MSNLKTKAFAVFIAAAFIVAMSGGSVAYAASLTSAQISAIISLLQSFGADATTISSVSSALSGTPVVTPVTGGAYSFTKDLTVGSTGDDVKELQKYLNSAGYAVAASGVGSAGNESTSFGSLTKSAVAKWQAANGLSPAAGYFGSLSRAKYVALMGGVVVTPVTPGVTPVPVTGANLAVAAGTQPASSLFPLNSTRVPFTVIKMTAGSSDVTVNSMTAERTGLAVDASFSGVVLLDEAGTQVGIAKTLNSTHQVILNEAFTVKAGQTRVMTLAGNGATASGSRGGQIAYLSLVAVSASTDVSDLLPIVGAGHTVNESLTVGSVSSMARGSLDPGSSQTKEVGTSAYVFSGVKATAGSTEDIYLKSIRWNQTGSAGSGDLANLKTYVEGVGSYDVVLSSDGKYYTSTFPENSGKGILIAKGFSKDIYIKGDVTGGSSRTAIFSIAKRTDLGVVGALYGYGINPPQTSNCTDDTTSYVSCFRSVEDPWYRGSTVTVSSGSMTVSTSASAPSQNIAINLANQPFGAFDVDVKGEPISVAKMAFNVTLTGNDTTKTLADLTSVSLYDENGKVVAGPIDGTATEGSATGLANGEFVFTDTVVFPIGKHTYSLKGKVGTDITNGMTVKASTTPSSDFTTVRGQTTNNTITPNPTSALSLSTMTVKSGSFTVSVSSDPTAQTIIAGNKGFTFANYIFDVTSSGEDVRVTSIPLAYDFTSGSSANELTNCQLWDGATSLTTGSNTVSPTAKASTTSFVFDGTGIILAKGTAKTLSLKCDLSGSATTSSQYYWGIDSDQNSSYTAASGVTSGQTIAETFNDSVGQRMTVATGGTLAVSLDSGSPGYTIVSSGTTGATLSKIKFSATNENINLKQIALRLSGSTASSSRSDLVASKVTIWDGTTQVGEAVFPTAITATSTLTTTVTIPNGGAKVLTIKGDIQPIAFNGVINKSGDLLKVNYDGANVGLNGTYGTGASSGTTINGGTSDTAASGIRIMRAYPTIAKLAVPSSSLISTAGKTLYRFSVTANGGDVALYKMSFVIGSSSVQATTSTYGLYAYTDSGFSSIDSAFTSDGLVNYGSCVGGRSDVT
ncbi:MAG: peptidoglycan-binding protein, partial [Candidatus Niyogibacteria bacterium]|nr:peptidoglycan-binding protein [Candidatus Niyogibacteria bacterium]